MSHDFNIDEILEIACHIERNGARFYRQAAGGIPDPPIQQMMLNFALMEEGHEKLFMSMKMELSDQDRKQTIFDPEGETALYLKAFADLFVYDEKKGDDFVLSQEMSAEAKMRKVLRAAINLEWESIAFYSGMKESVPDGLGKGKIDGIIKEEMRHVRLLTDNLGSLNG